MQTVPPRKLRETIAEAMRAGMTRPKIEAFCAEDLELDPPKPLDGLDIASYSKREYVEAILADKTLTELADIAVQVAAEINAPDLLELVGRIGPTGVSGQLKNLIFAADGPKPKIVFRDAINNDIAVVENERYCLVYDRPLRPGGLTWRELTGWWAEREGPTTATEREIWMSLYQRLDQSLARNEAEQRILRTYVQRYQTHGSDIPALIPQVYLHYDPYTRAQHGLNGSSLTRQCMDFLLLLPNRVRVVIECDGIQHYADESRRADPRRYAKMVAEDRQLRLRGYEVYRFGGYELMEGSQPERLLTDFFDALSARHSR